MAIEKKYIRHTWVVLLPKITVFRIKYKLQFVTDMLERLHVVFWTELLLF